MGYVFEDFRDYEQDIEECARLLLPQLPGLCDPNELKWSVERYASLLHNFGYSFHEIAETFVRRDLRMMLLVYYADVGTDLLLRQSGESPENENTKEPLVISQTRWGINLKFLELLTGVKVYWEKTKIRSPF